MLFIFRKLRRSFFLPGKVRTYCAYAAGEIILIVVGILIAVQIGEWKAERKDRREEHQILISLENQFEDLLRRLESTTTRYNNLAYQIRDLLNASSVDELPIAEIESGLGALLWAGTFDPGSGALEAVLSSGRLELIENYELRNRLAEWSQGLSEASDGQLAMRDFVLTTFVPRLASMGIEVGGAMSTHQPDHWQVRTGQDPKLYRKMLRNSEFRSLAEYRYNWASFSSRDFKRTAESCSSILNLIRQELRKAE